MNHNPAEFLMTYDPDRLEEHSDSSDFEEFAIPVNCTGYCAKLRNTFLRKRNKINEYCNIKNSVYNKRVKDDNNAKCFYKPNNFDKNNISSQSQNNVYKGFKNNNNKSNNSGDKINFKETSPIKSKCSMIRHKVIPCLSNIFSRTNNNLKHTTTVQENHTRNAYKDNGCQAYCAFCKHKQIRKHSKCQQNYSVRPIYTIECCKGHDTKIVPYYPKRTYRARLPEATIKITRNVFSNTSFSLTSLAENVSDEMIPTKERNELEIEIKKSSVKHPIKRQGFMDHEQQLSLKQVYHVLAAPENFQNKAIGSSTPDIASQTNTIINSNSSTFWEYLFDRINKRYLTQKVETKKQHNSYNILKMPPFKKEASTCCIDCDIGTAYSNCTCKLPYSNPVKKPQDENISELPPLSAMIDKKRAKQNVQCKCFPNKTSPKPPLIPKASPVQPPPTDDTNRPCQEPHSKVTQGLSKMYNKEIICIHNPPCILINGCLNIPLPNDQPDPAWVVTQGTKSSFYQVCQKFESVKRNSQQADRSTSPLIEQQYQVENKTEKVTQSICNHDPPCDVVRRCFRVKCNPKFAYSCIHVPMCQKIPECLVENEDTNITSCSHKPKCTEVPMCNKNYIVLSAKDTIGTQVKPKTRLMCRHIPPCIMIPKCLGRLMTESYLPYDAIPGCNHQPLCEMIPACCRKTPKMVSVYSQYPAPCRIV